LSSAVAINAKIAANESHSAGMARLPVMPINAVTIAGVKPPKIAVARLKASEYPVARTLAGMISVRNGTIAPLELAKMMENQSSTKSSFGTVGEATSQR
jgi:hypothetical protein